MLDAARVIVPLFGNICDTGIASLQILVRNTDLLIDRYKAIMFCLHVLLFLLDLLFSFGDISAYLRLVFFLPLPKPYHTVRYRVAVL